jgi:enterochelin esterase-like enzyme
MPTPTLPPLPTSLPTPTQTPDCRALPGQLVDGVVNTTLLAKPMTFHVYLPPCYADEQAQRYPVLYLLHGQTYNEDQWIRLGVPTTADRLIAAGQVTPFIVVFPYDYSYLQPWQYPFEQVFMQLLVPQIDTTYRTLPDAAHRAVGGLSRGGAWALHLGLRHPDVFGAIGGHSAAIFYSDAGTLPITVRDIPANQLPRIYLDAANDDSELKSSENIRQMLDNFKVPYEWHESPGFHDEAYWGAHVEDYLRWYAGPWQSNP